MKYTKETLAELVDISPQFLANIERGKKGMSFTTLKNLCFALGTSCDCIILGKEAEGGESRIFELISSVDKEYLPYIESIVSQTIRLIAAMKKDGGK